MPAIGWHGPDQLNASGNDTVALPLVTRQVDQFGEAVPLFREIDGYHDREPALIEGDRTGQARPFWRKDLSELMATSEKPASDASARKSSSRTSLSPTRSFPPWKGAGALTSAWVSRRLT
jgi:hypothetical protein